jgi:antitoxin ParD1/3/4
MAALKINLDDSVQHLAEERAVEAGYKSIDEYLSSLIVNDAEQELDPETERQLLEGMNSESIDVTPQFWRDLREKIRIRTRSRKT